MAYRHQAGGFTVIEAAFAVIVGMIVMAGGILAFNSVRSSVGDSKAQDKIYAVASVVEEQTGLAAGVPPTLERVDQTFHQRHADADRSPWGGVCAGGSAPQPIVNMYSQGNTSIYTTSNWESGWNSSSGWTLTNAASNGQIVYATGPSTSSFYDVVSRSETVVKVYMIGIADNHGEGPRFVRGGR